MSLPVKSNQRTVLEGGGHLTMGKADVTLSVCNSICSPESLVTQNTKNALPTPMGKLENTW